MELTRVWWTVSGYYADQQSAGNETRGNSSASNVWVKHDARGFHLNNLSYAGPIVMGVGGKYNKYPPAPFVARFFPPRPSLLVKPGPKPGAAFK